MAKVLIVIGILCCCIAAIISLWVGYNVIYGEGRLTPGIPVASAFVSFGSMLTGLGLMMQLSRRR